ncbi:MAG TPA: endo alpha-1,4 polygalactosaminidase, partial [Thermomicrobiales bacterium]|nr:endo alpha-1,4 polygalactosaminidase [Thermomicrobiales bacterium]
HWPGERWLDIRSPKVMEIMQARIDLAQQKKCDAVDPDNVDVATNHSGFPITLDQQLGYIRGLADSAHTDGLAMGLKNDVEQIPQLVGKVEFTVNEECFKYNECDTLKPFTDAGKPVLQIEYGKAKKAHKICPEANDLGFATLIKKLNLGAKLIACTDRPQAKSAIKAGRRHGR